MQSYFVIHKVRCWYYVAGGFSPQRLKSDNLFDAVLEFAESYWLDFMSMNPSIKVDVKKFRVEIVY